MKTEPRKRNGKKAAALAALALLLVACVAMGTMAWLTATDELTNQLQRSPSVAEIAEYLGSTVDEVLEAMESSSAYSSVPLEGGGSGEDDEAPSVIDHYATEDPDLAASDDRIVLEQAIADFSPREQEVVKMRFEEGLTQVEIAERLGISQVQVSRLLRRTLRRIQDKIDPEGLMHA